MGSISAFFKLSVAGWVLAREGVIAALPRELFQGPAGAAHSLATLLARRGVRGAKRSERLTNALNRLGPSWVKMGQFLATRPDVVGIEIASELEMLQDRMQPFPVAQARAAVEASLGRNIDELFEDFSDPVAAASVAQVHKARLKSTGEAVAVKVIRPGVRQRFNRDLDVFFTLARFQERHVPASRRLRPVAVTELLAHSAKIEMDLRMEAAALSEMAQNTQDDPGFRVPMINWELTGRDCLTMEWIDGIKLTDGDALVASGHDPVEIAQTLMQSFLRHTLRDGFFHADMHPGNLFVDDQGKIVAVDLGITGRLGRKEQHFLAEILYGFIVGNYQRVAQVHFDAGYVPQSHAVTGFAQAIRAIGEPIHGQPAETISMAKLLTLLFEVTELFDMEARPELILLQKTMVVVEGVCRKLDPAFNMWQVSEPVVGQWVRRNVGPAGKFEEAAQGLKSLSALAFELPEMAMRAKRLSLELDRMAQDGVKLDAGTISALARAQAQHNRSGRFALIVIALTAIMGLYFWK